MPVKKRATPFSYFNLPSSSSPPPPSKGSSTQVPSVPANQEPSTEKTPSLMYFFEDKDYESILKRFADKNIVLVFYGNECTYCQRGVDVVKNACATQSDCVFLLVHNVRNQTIFQRYQISAMPTYGIITPGDKPRILPPGESIHKLFP